MQCNSSPWSNHAYCPGDAIDADPCGGSTDDGLLPLALGYIKAKVNDSSLECPRPTPTLALNRTSSVPTVTSIISSNQTVCTLPSCPSSARAKAGIEAGVGVPLGAAVAAFLVWALRERRLRKRVETAQWFRNQDIGGIASTMK